MIRWSVRSKLAATSVATAAAALLAFSVTLFVHDRAASRAALVRRLAVEASVVGDSCTAAVAFGDESVAGEALHALRGATEVLEGAIYGRDGSLLAAYAAPGVLGAVPSTAPRTQRAIGPDGVLVVTPVMLKDEPIGTIYLRGHTLELDRRLRQLAVVVSTLFIGALLLAYLLGSRLQRAITAPVLELAAVTGEVRSSGDYSRRVAVRGGDEVGVLAAGFNQMLAAIEERDRELARQRQTLELTVARRTAELAASNQALEAQLLERQLLEEQFAHAQKMEAVGRLAGGVAHDFNNILAVVVSSARALEHDLPEGEARDIAGEIARAGERGAALTRQLLAFGRKQVLHPRPLDVAETIGELGRMLGRVIGEHIRVDIDVSAQVGAVYMDPAQLEQALLNLAVNARDAMPSGGTLSIKVDGADVDAQGAARMRVRAGRYVRVAVADTGCGMSADVARRVFEPFYTTKPLGKGTGLGLAMVYGAVEQSGGHVEVASAPSNGTTFTLLLPAVDETVELDPLRRAAVPAPRGRGEIVLLVEDDSQVRLAVRRMLEGAGYSVVEANGADEALACVEAAPGAFAAVLTDLVMPGRSGVALGRELAERCPGVPVLYMSGYSGDMLGGDAAVQPERILAKPFAREDLLERLRAAIDGEREAAA